MFIFFLLKMQSSKFLFMNVAISLNYSLEQIFNKFVASLYLFQVTFFYGGKY